MSYGIFQAFATDDAGNVIPNCAYSVLNNDGDLVSLFSDRDGTIGIPNPATADADGFIQFYTSSGFVTVSATSGSTNRVWSDVLIAGTAATVDTTSDSSVIDAGISDVVVVTPAGLEGSKYNPNTNSIRVEILAVGVYTSGTYSYPNSYTHDDFNRIEIYGIRPPYYNGSTTLTNEMIDDDANWEAEIRASNADGSDPRVTIVAASTTSYTISQTQPTQSVAQIVGYLKPEVL